MYDAATPPLPGSTLSMEEESLLDKVRAGEPPSVKPSAQIPGEDLGTTAAPSSRKQHVAAAEDDLLPSQSQEMTLEEMALAQPAPSRELAELSSRLEAQLMDKDKLEMSETNAQELATLLLQPLGHMDSPQEILTLVDNPTKIWDVVLENVDEVAEQLMDQKTLLATVIESTRHACVRELSSIDGVNDTVSDQCVSQVFDVQLEGR